ncbi:MAG: hypothetical protein ACI87O_002148 [Planctomycetota bacterium]|jgi:hypothetical protein
MWSTAPYAISKTKIRTLSAPRISCNGSRTSRARPYTAGTSATKRTFSPTATANFSTYPVSRNPNLSGRTEIKMAPRPPAAKHAGKPSTNLRKVSPPSSKTARSKRVRGTSGTQGALKTTQSNRSPDGNKFASSTRYCSDNFSLFALSVAQSTERSSRSVPRAESAPRCNRTNPNTPVPQPTSSTALPCTSK